MRLIGYCRVSTDDKGQNPERQRDVIQSWANRDGHTILAWVTDEGTSGAKDPFQRQAVLEAIEQAHDLKADGLAVEAVDRWTREGMEALAVSKFLLRIDHDGLVLAIANSPPGLPPAMMQLFDGMLAASAQMWLDRHKAAVKSGIAKAKALGFPKGQPGGKPKPPLSPPEMEIVAQLAANGKGVDAMSVELSRIRGAHDVADRKAQRRLQVRPTWLWERIRSQMPDLAGRMGGRSGKNQPLIEVKSERMEATP